MGEILRLYDGFRVKTVIFYDEEDLHERQPSLVRTEPIVIVRGDLQHRGRTVNLPSEPIPFEVGR